MILEITKFAQPKRLFKIEPTTWALFRNKEERLYPFEQLRLSRQINAIPLHAISKHTVASYRAYRLPTSHSSTSSRFGEQNTSETSRQRELATSPNPQFPTPLSAVTCCTKNLPSICDEASASNTLHCHFNAFIRSESRATVFVGALCPFCRFIGTGWS